MAGLDPAIHIFLIAALRAALDGRLKAAHGEEIFYFAATGMCRVIIARPCTSVYWCGVLAGTST